MPHQFFRKETRVAEDFIRICKCRNMQFSTRHRIQKFYSVNICVQAVFGKCAFFRFLA